MVVNTGPKRMKGRKIAAVKQAAGRRKKRPVAYEHLLAQREAELTIINSVQEGLASKLDMPAIYELVGQKIREVFNVEVVDIVNYDEDNNLISMPYSYEKGDHSVFSPREPYGFRWHVIKTQEPLLINQNLVELAAQYNNPLLTGDWPKSVLFVPLLVEGKVKSVISIQDLDREGAFDDSDVQLLQTLARAMSVALENVRLFKSEQRAHEQAEILRSVAQALNRSLSLTEVLDLVLTELQKVIPYDSAAIYKVDERHRVFVTGRGFTNLAELIGVGFEFNRTDDEIGYLISQSLQPLILEDALQAYPQYFNAGAHAPAQIRGYMAVPIVLDQKMIGVLTLDKNEPGFYNDGHARLAMAFADQAATALNNARLFDRTQRLLKETQQRNAELAIINRVQAALASRLDMQATYDLIGDRVREIFDANTVALATFDFQQDLMHRHYIIERGVRYTVEPGPIPITWRQFILRGQSTLINHDLLTYMKRLDPDFDVPVGDVPKSSLSVPLRINGELSGVISVQNVDRENAFSESDLRLLETLANSLSVAIENARLWEQESLYRKALQRELEIGREIQAGFLPEVLPQVEGWEIAAALMSAREVAGDFYDAFELPDGNIGLVIADVCDKGVGAALFMTLFRSLIRITATQEIFEHAQAVSAPCCISDRLEHAMSLTNNYIAETHGKSGMFATLFFGILEPRAGALTYVNAGHEPPLILRADQRLEFLRKTGRAVGAIMDSKFSAVETHLSSGDMLFAFTDGAPDAQNPHGDFFGRERLFDLLERKPDSAQAVIQSVEAELHQYIANATQFDDVTLLAARRI